MSEVHDFCAAPLQLACIKALFGIVRDGRKLEDCEADPTPHAIAAFAGSSVNGNNQFWFLTAPNRQPQAAFS
jgi:hypothetical protein